jgi:hypothetical protein
MKTGLILVAIFLAVVAYLSMQPSSPSVSTPVAADGREAKVMLYMSCLGFSSSAADKALKAAGGDVDKVLTMTHMAVSGELSGEPPLTEREKTCRKSSGL